VVKGYENNIILPPPEFRDDYEPPVSTQEYEDNIIPPPSEFRDDYKPPVSTLKIEITPLKQALKNSVESYKVR